MVSSYFKWLHWNQDLHTWKMLLNRKFFEFEEIINLKILLWNDLTINTTVFLFIDPSEFPRIACELNGSIALLDKHVKTLLYLVIRSKTLDLFFFVRTKKSIKILSYRYRFYGMHIYRLHACLFKTFTDNILFLFDSQTG